MRTAIRFVKEQSYSEIFRMLSITRIELDFLGTSPLCELEKK